MILQGVQLSIIGEEMRPIKETSADMMMLESIEMILTEVEMKIVGLIGIITMIRIREGITEIKMIENKDFFKEGITIETFHGETIIPMIEEDLINSKIAIKIHHFSLITTSLQTISSIKVTTSLEINKIPSFKITIKLTTLPSSLITSHSKIHFSNRIKISRRVSSIKITLINSKQIIPPISIKIEGL